jgi:hypothetical protein
MELSVIALEPFYYSWTNGWTISTRASDVNHGTLCTPRSDNLTDQISVQSDFWLGHQGAKTENTKSATTPELMAGSSPNFYHGYIYGNKDTWHFKYPGFLFDQLFEVTEVKVCMGPLAEHVL